MNKGNYRGAFTECNSKQQNVFSLFSSPSQDDQCFGFLKGILQNAEEDNQQEYLYQRSGQIAAYQPKQKFSIQKRLFKDSDNQYNDISEDYRYEENSIAQNLGNNQQNIFDQKNVGQIFQHQRNLFGQQQQSSYGAYHHYAQTVYQEKQPEESRILNLNVKSSRNLMSSFQTINETQQQSCSEQDEEKFQSPTQIVSNQDSQRQAVYEKLQYQEKQCTQDSSFPNNVFNKRVLKNQYLSDYQLNQKASQSSSSSSNKKESLQQPHNNIFAQFQNQQNQYSVLKSQFPSSQHQQQQLIEINRYKGFQSKKGNEIVFQTQTQLSSASSQNQQSSNKENSQNTSHSSTSSSGLSGYTYSGDVQNQTNNSQDSSSSQKQSQYKNQMITSQKKLQQQLQKELNPKIFQMSHARLSAYQSNFVPLKQQQTIILPDNSKDQQNIIQKQISQANLEQKSQYTENVNKQAQAYSTSSSSLSSSKSQIQSSTHPSCSSPSSQSSCSSDAQNNLRNLSFSSSLKISLPSPSLATNQNQQTAQNVYNQNVTQGKSQKSLGSSGKKPFGKSKQPVYYEKQQVNTTQNLQFVEQQQSLPYQTPLKKECQSPSISSCQDDTYQNQYGFNSPLYTPNTVGKLHKIKETFYESTPINEFKQRFARKIKQLRQELKDNCKTPEGSQINVQSSCSSILQKEIKQKLSFVEILGTSIAKMSQIKPNIYWKLMFELADYAKKDCMYHEAKYFYKIAINLQPFCPDIWLEYAKMEEDYGNLQKAKEILENAYPFCKMSDSLILKLLRIIEKIGKIEDIRVILSNLNQLKIDKCWKIYIEGAFIEIRFGNIKNAERILKMLHSYLDLNGQVCYEYARVLELQGKYQQALNICQQAQDKGLKCTSLWTLYLKLYEKTCTNIQAPVLDKFIRQANASLPKEIIWKIYLEIAQICEKKNAINLAKQYLVMSIRNAHESMRWKPLIQVAKIELLLGNKENANKVIQKTLEACSDKQKPYLIIEAAKCAEIAGDISSAISQIESLKSYMKSEWKIYMEYISMLIRNKKHREASQVIKESLYTHTLAGRLWGELIQLEHIKATNNDLNSAFEFFLVALEEVPKSGEVWCEGARLCMNPFGNKYDLMKAKQFLEYAIFFTPQYGDSFIEALRLYTILGERDQIKQLKNKTIISQPNYGHLWYYMKETTRDTSIDVWKKMKKLVTQEVDNTFVYYQKRMASIDLQSEKQYTPMITGLTEYNDLFFNENIPQEIRWKTIFYLDQSLNQI
ncbi:hypothetical protein TTHERM_00048880 (macronuclear) [Tetrahymena thermophila SB210]|uniref:Tetratricopeptide repeat protein n=1 Tax=Tetrahymena thermophila (strain SB210) TaxID=312017 RepID=Q23DA2_TETTS|nr:hypothetical protein TTHERM_00048880 [Tetrahymena thermophila SB210]EAR94542.2 hypothetical protein TTHERM_00048880 [Tetrahymena thermophila SB210]|eukprot:XP_001014784.2 hypothetical protein TTHERM_00048880 [Tetrahymena thermophila SB210]